MLREGFDVSNVCVIVPLRSSEAPILLEQVIGRGLRLMWREPEYADIKAEMRAGIAQKKVPSAHFDILHIVEHPAFLQFYEDLDQTMVMEETDETPREHILGDIIPVGLKENYRELDFYIPCIIRNQEELLTDSRLSLPKGDPFAWSLEQLQAQVERHEGEVMVSEEVTVHTRFGEYKVRSSLFTARHYNDYLAKIVTAITSNVSNNKSRSNHRRFPTLQIHQASLMGYLDDYIRTKLFNKPFNPLEGNNWRVLMAGNHIVEYIIRLLSSAIYELQQNVEVEDAVVVKKFFSEVETMNLRANFTLNITKSIYEKTAYPSHKGEYEKQFMLYADADSEVERLLKIDPNYHFMAGLRYIRTDGHFATYYPDFLAKIGESVYLVETKAQKDVSQEDVLQKKRGALNWLKKINALRTEDRMNATWHYVILGDKKFKEWRAQNASIKDMMEWSELTSQSVDHLLL